MSKRNEGYTLPFVLVVMIVLCLVATSLMSLSLRNLQSQQRVVEKMEKKYQAQGAIEVVLGTLAKVETLSGSDTNGISLDAGDALQKEIERICGSVYDRAQEPDIQSGSGEETDEETLQNFTYEFSLVSYNEKVKVTCDLQMSGKIGKDADNYQLKDTKIIYKSYTISNIPEGGGAG